MTKLSRQQTIHVSFHGIEKCSVRGIFHSTLIFFLVHESLLFRGQEGTLQKRCPFDSSPFSRSEIREKARRRIARARLETFTKSLFQTVRYDPWCIRSCSFIFYSVAITPDSKSRQSCARQLRDPKTFPQITWKRNTEGRGGPLLRPGRGGEKVTRERERECKRGRQFTQNFEPFGEAMSAGNGSSLRCKGSNSNRQQHPFG